MYCLMPRNEITLRMRKLPWFAAGKCPLERIPLDGTGRTVCFSICRIVNREEAKTVLAACRPNGADAKDPLLAEALALVQRDGELRAWFEAEQAADQAIAAKLKAVALPDDLLERVRAGARARITSKPRQPSFALALAASFALLGLLAVLWWNRTPSAPAGSFAAYRMDMAQFLRAFPKLDLTTDRLP